MWTTATNQADAKRWRSHPFAKRQRSLRRHINSAYPQRRENREPRLLDGRHAAISGSPNGAPGKWGPLRSRPCFWERYVRRTAVPRSVCLRARRRFSRWGWMHRRRPGETLPMYARSRGCNRAARTGEAGLGERRLTFLPGAAPRGSERSFRRIGVSTRAGGTAWRKSPGLGRV